MDQLKDRLDYGSRPSTKSCTGCDATSSERRAPASVLCFKPPHDPVIVHIELGIALPIVCILLPMAFRQLRDPLRH